VYSTIEASILNVILFVEDNRCLHPVNIAIAQLLPERDVWLRKVDLREREEIENG
jgi:hypothetical protein